VSSTLTTSAMKYIITMLMLCLGLIASCSSIEEPGDTTGTVGYGEPCESTIECSGYLLCINYDCADSPSNRCCKYGVGGMRKDEDAGSRD